MSKYDEDPIVAKLFGAFGMHDNENKNKVKEMSEEEKSYIKLMSLFDQYWVKSKDSGRLNK